MGESSVDVPKTIDNVSCRLGDDIAGFLVPDATVYISSTGFSLSAFERLADELESVKEVRFVFTAPAFVPQTAIKEKLTKERREFYIPGVGEASLLGTEYEIRLRNRLMQKAVARRRACRFKRGVPALSRSGGLSLADRCCHLESFYKTLAASVSGLVTTASETFRAFNERHYKLESLRADLSDVEKRISKEKQLDRKYALLKERQRMVDAIARCECEGAC